MAFAYITPDGTLPTTDLIFGPLQNGWVLDNPLQWSGFITYPGNNNDRNDQSPVFSGQCDVWSPIPIDFGGICVGGTIHLSVAATIRDSITGATDNAPWDGTNQILGQNPTVADIKTRLGTLTCQVIAYKESRFRQFGADGLPFASGDHGYGIMQLTKDPVPSSTQIWSWKDNVDAGIAKYNAGITHVNNHYNNLIKTNPNLPALTPDQLKPAYYQFYNAGGHKGTSFYWVPNATGNDWMKNPNSAYIIYGDNAVMVENSVSAGTPPSDWN